MRGGDRESVVLLRRYTWGNSAQTVVWPHILVDLPSSEIRSINNTIYPIRLADMKYGFYGTIALQILV
jgi:hypothetical protein